MLNYRTKAIIKREVKEQIFSKRFIFATLSLPLFFLVIFGLQFVFLSYEGGRENVLVFAEDDQVLALLENQFNEFLNERSENLQVDFRRSSKIERDVFLEENRELILAGEISGLLFVPGSAQENKEVLFYSNNAGNQNLLNSLNAVINNALLTSYVNSRNMDDSVIDFVRKNVLIEHLRVTDSGTTSGDTTGQQALAGFFNFLLYMSIFVIGMPAMGAVNEEKVNRVVEVVLSSVSAAELMAGKVIGSAIAGFTQMLIWFVPVILLATGSIPVLIALGDINIQLSLFSFCYFMLNYLIGVLIFLSIFAAFGAMFDNPQDAQSSMFPVMMLIIVPFLLAFAVINNPTSMLGLLGSMMPFFAILVMPVRMVLIDVPLWQFVVAILVNLATLYLVIRLTGKIYRFTILMTGKRASWKEVYKWLRYQ